MLGRLSSLLLRAGIDGLRDVMFGNLSGLDDAFSDSISFVKRSRANRATGLVSSAEALPTGRGDLTRGEGGAGLVEIGRNKSLPKARPLG